MISPKYAYYGAAEAWPASDTNAELEQSLLGTLIEVGERRRTEILSKIGTITTAADTILES